MKLWAILSLLAGLVLLIVLGNSVFTVRETDTVILTQFGRPVGEPITEPGLHWRTPFVQEVNRLEKRVLEFDAPSTSMSTKDKTYLEVDTFGRWRISDPTEFFVSLRDERSAQSRLEDIIGSEVRAAVARHELIEIIRSDKNRKLPPVKAGDLLAVRTAGAYGAVQASTYNTRPLVPEVMVNGDQYAIVRERVEVDDLIALDRVPDWLAD